MALTMQSSIAETVMEGDSGDVESKDTGSRSSPPPPGPKEGRGRRVRARGSEQDSAYFSSGGLQAPVTPRVIAKARARAVQQHKELDNETFVPPSLPKAQSLPTLTHALHFVDQVRKVNSNKSEESK